MHRRTLLKTGVAATAGLLPAASGALTSAATAAPRVNRVLAKDLRVPWGLTFLLNGNALVGERETARVFVVKKKGGKRLIGTVPGVAGGAPGEGGLLGLALSPGFVADRWLYAYVSTARDNQVLRMRYANGTIGAPEPLVTGIPNATSHHGGRLMSSTGCSSPRPATPGTATSPRTRTPSPARSSG